jgi:hypothetical protein
MGDIEGLAESIKELGLLQGIGVTKDNELIFGQRRIEAFKMLGLTDIPARVIDIESILQGEEAENNIRKDFTISERVAIASAKEVEIGKRSGRPSSEIVALGPQFTPGEKTREIAARKAGFSSATNYRRAKFAVDKGIPDLVEALDRGDIAIRPAAEIANFSEEEQAKFSEVFTGEKTLKEVQQEIGWDNERPVDPLVAQVIEDEEAGIFFPSEAEALEAFLQPDHRKKEIEKIRNHENDAPDPDDIVEEWKRGFEAIVADLLLLVEGNEDLWISNFRELNAGAIADEMTRQVIQEQNITYRGE